MMLNALGVGSQAAKKSKPSCRILLNPWFVTFSDWEKIVSDAHVWIVETKSRLIFWIGLR